MLYASDTGHPGNLSELSCKPGTLNPVIVWVPEH